MKKIIASIILSVSSLSSMASYFDESISQIIAKDNSSVQSMRYAATRCSGMYIAISQTMSTPKIIEISKILGFEMIMLSARIEIDLLKNKYPEKAVVKLMMDSSFSMSEIYEKMMKDSRLMKNDLFANPVVEKDLAFCGSFAKKEGFTE